LFTWGPTCGTCCNRQTQEISILNPGKAGAYDVAAPYDEVTLPFEHMHHQQHAAEAEGEDVAMHIAPSAWQHATVTCSKQVPKVVPVTAKPPLDFGTLAAKPEKSAFPPSAPPASNFAGYQAMEATGSDNLANALEPTGVPHMPPTAASLSLRLAAKQARPLECLQMASPTAAAAAAAACAGSSSSSGTRNLLASNSSSSGKVLGPLKRFMSGTNLGLRVLKAKESPRSTTGKHGDLLVSQIKELAALRSEGVLTEEEFVAAKAKLLNMEMVP